jgi:hypothetical protein
MEQLSVQLFNCPLRVTRVHVENESVAQRSARLLVTDDIGGFDHAEVRKDRSQVFCIRLGREVVYDEITPMYVALDMRRPMRMRARILGGYCVEIEYATNPAAVYLPIHALWCGGAGRFRLVGYSTYSTRVQYWLELFV